MILLDLQLPKLDGQEVLKEIKKSEKLKIIPVVVLTTSETEADIKEAYRNYTNSYLLKPIDFDEFKKMIEHVGFYWFIWNRHPWRDDCE